MSSNFTRIAFVLGLIVLSSGMGDTDITGLITQTNYTIEKPIAVTDCRYNKDIRMYSGKYMPDRNLGDMIFFLNDSLIVLDDILGHKADTVALSEGITSTTHHFFGDVASGIIYSSSFNYSDDEPDCVYKINLATGHVDRYFVEVDFADYEERFGRSLIDQFARNDTFYLGFQYPYIGPEKTGKLGIWDVPHMGIGYLKNDSIKFIKAFGYQKPELAEEYTWKHPKMYYLPNRNEILFAYYWSNILLVYDFKGNLKRQIRIDIDGFNNSQFYGNTYKSGCMGSGTWDAYMRDSVLHFSQVGFYEKEQLYYRTVNFAQGDSRGNSAIVLFNEDGEIVKMVSGFEDLFGFINLYPDYIYGWHKAYDSLNYRVIKYFKYEYPDNW